MTSQTLPKKKKLTVERLFRSKTPGSSIETDYEGPAKERLLPDLLDGQYTTYDNVHALATDYKVVSHSEALAYLPEETEPIDVTVGISTKANIKIKTRESVCLDSYMDYKKGFVLNTGCSIWSLDFCPKTPSKDSHPDIHYLAVAGYKSPYPELHSLDLHQPTGSYLNCIQIWRFDLSVKGAQRVPVLDMCLLHDYGVVIDAKWCPYGAYEETVESTDPNVLPKLGILAAAFGDSMPRALVIPHPEAIRALHPKVKDSQTVYMQIREARCVFHAPAIKPTVLSWAGDSRISCGTYSGQIIIWDAKTALKKGLKKDDKAAQSDSIILNTIVHDSAISGLVWRGMVDPVEYISTSLDGYMKICNSKDPFINMTFARSRAIMYKAVWMPQSDNICHNDADNMLHATHTGNTDYFKTGTRFFDSVGKLWDMSTCEPHTFLAASSADGMVRILNVHQLRRKGMQQTQRMVYALLYDKDTNKYTYVDGVRAMECDFNKFLPTRNRFVEAYYLISRVAWNPNRFASPWLASGAVSGLCRVDFTGVGHEWLMD